MGGVRLVVVMVEGVRSGGRVGVRLAIAIRLLVGRALDWTLVPPVGYPVNLQDVAVLRDHLVHLGWVPTSAYQLMLRGKRWQGRSERKVGDSQSSEEGSAWDETMTNYYSMTMESCI